MHKLFLLALLMLLAVPFCQAQTTDTGRPEIFIGYSNLQAEGLPSQLGSPNNGFTNDIFGDRTGLHGFDVEITGYLTPRFGLTGDFSLNQRSRNFSGTNTAGGTTQNRLETRVINVLGGPQLRFPNQTRAVPFIRALFGIANTRFEAESQQTATPGGTFTSSFSTNATDFAMALGGGLDVRLNNRFSLRAFQLDYNPVFLRERSINVLGTAGALETQTLESNRQDNIRIGVGVVIK